MYDLCNRKIFVAGHRGLVGGALLRRLEREDCEILTAGREQVDLIRQDQVEKFLQHERPDAIIIAAATVGGIMANSTYPVEFLYNNLMIKANVTAAAHAAGVNRILSLGS